MNLEKNIMLDISSPPPYVDTNIDNDKVVKIIIKQHEKIKSLESKIKS